MDIGILDFGDVSNAKSAAEVVEGVISYAVRAEKLGFSRFWLSEHHPRSVVWSNSLMMLGILGTQTSTINIGAGGILSAFQSPYHIYDQFRQLSIVFPNRIDIGYSNGVPVNNIQELLLNKKIAEEVSVDYLYEENTKKAVLFFNNSHGEENIHSLTSPKPNNWI